MAPIGICIIFLTEHPDYSDYSNQTCKRLPNVTIDNSNVTRIGNDITYTCDIGHYFSDETNEKQHQCSSCKYWENIQDFGNCTREYNLKLLDEFLFSKH